MNDQEAIDRLNANAPNSLKVLGGKVAELDMAGKSCTLSFDVSPDFCHSVNVVQGRFVTSMLDAAMSHAAFGTDADIVNVSSMEISTKYLEPTLAGSMRSVGTVIKAGYKMAFMEGRLYNEAGLLTATATTVAKLIREKK